MYDFNGDYETFFTGKQFPQKSGLYDTYKGSQHLPQWEEDYCSNITGASDGTKFESFLEPNDTVKFFRKSLCRPIHMVRTISGSTVHAPGKSSHVNINSIYFRSATQMAKVCSQGWSPASMYSRRMLWTTGSTKRRTNAIVERETVYQRD